MSFTSIPFLWFLAAFLPLYGLCPALYRRYLLLVGSLVFAFIGSPAAGLWAIGFVFANFILGNCVQRTTDRRLVLAMAIAINVMFLMTFKSVNAVPVGLSYSFFAFIAYLVEIYRGSIEAELDPVRFASFGLFFPKFTMGPITRYGELASQMDRGKLPSGSIQRGLEDFTLGFILKILVCDKLSVLFGGKAEDLATGGYQFISTDLAWFGALVTSLHIYLEWIAYMYMALGIAWLLGFRLPQNFNYPYMARTVGDYYRRWHMSLTRWFKDYVYIPLGGSRQGLGKTTANVLFVWLLTSLWHGNGLSTKYLLWGLAATVAMVLDPIYYNKTVMRIGHRPAWSIRVLGHLPLLLLLLVSILILREPAPGYNFILWGMSIGVIIVIERLWKTFVVERFQFGKRFGTEDHLGKIWQLFVSALAHLWVVITMMLSWVLFTIKDFDMLKLYFTRLFPAEGQSSGIVERDLANRFENLWFFVLVGVIFCFPVVDRLMHAARRSRRGSWVLSTVLAGLFWYAIYILINNGSNPMGYAGF